MLCPSIVDEILSRYPVDHKNSAVMPLLSLIQKQETYLTKDSIQWVADTLGMPLIRVYEVATFYTMYRLNKPGKHIIQVCTTTPCALRGANDLVTICENVLGIKMGETTQDRHFTLEEIECAGACVNAPIMTFDGAYYEDLSPERLTTLLAQWQKSEETKPGSQIGRKNSAPAQ
jgi:NADH dehydrogenase (ubiquinone) flavoprotein 2